MGAGKTSVGRALATKLGWSFVDLDDRIEAQRGRKIATIFREDSEPAFRRMETEALRELLEELGTQPGAAGPRSLAGPQGTVIALGGGAFVQPENAQMLAGLGAPVVFLDAPVEELRRRCGRLGDPRPLYADENQFRQLYEARRRGYMAAGFRVETGGKTVAEVATELVQRLELG